LASSPIKAQFASFDGVEIAFHVLGEGRPVVLLHGLFSSAHVNWIKFGHAREIASRGYRVVMPDLRAHGESAAPHDPTHYPPDVLSRDLFALVEHLGLEDYDLGGYSLGARTAARSVIMGADPRRLIIAGMGLEGMLNAIGRGEHFRRVLTAPGSFKQGSAEWLSEAFLKTTGGDPKALLPLLDSFVDTDREALTKIRQPTLILSGSEDGDNGSSEDLAALLDDAIFLETPGNHMNVITKPAFGKAIADFLTA
jgi:pimeloyl-ACP methyl ester carboxylesterase